MADLSTTESDLEPIIHAINTGVSAQTGEPDLVVNFGCRRIVMRYV